MSASKTTAVPPACNSRRLPLGLTAVILSPLALAAMAPLGYVLLDALLPAPGFFAGGQTPTQQAPPIAAAPPAAPDPPPALFKKLLDRPGTDSAPPPVRKDFQPLTRFQTLTPDGGVLLSVYASQRVVRVAHPGTGKSNATAVDGLVECGAVSADGRCAILGVRHGAAAKVQLWEPEVLRHWALTWDPGCNVTAVAVTADGRCCAAGGADGTVQWWDVATGRPLGQRDAHQGAVTALTFSPDGKRLATGGVDQVVKLWHENPGAAATVWKSGTSPVQRLVFSPDGRWLAGSSPNNDWLKKGPTSALLCDTATGTAKRLGSFAEVTAMAFSTDSTTLAVGGYQAFVAMGLPGLESIIALYDVATASVRVSSAPKEGSFQVRKVDALAFSGDGRTVWYVSSELAEQRWELPRPLARKAFAHTWQPTALALSADGRHLATASTSGGVFVWEVASGQRVGGITAHDDAVNALAFSPDGSRLVSAGDDRVVKVWDWAAGRLVKELAGHTRPVQSVAFSPDGKTLATGAGSLLHLRNPGEVLLWDLAGGKKPVKLPSVAEAVFSVAFLPDGKTLAAGCGDVPCGSVLVWDLGDLKAPKQLTGHRSAVGCLAVAPDGNTLAAGDWTGTVVLWDVGAGTKKGICGGPHKKVVSVGFDRPTGLLLTVGEEGALAICDNKGAPVHSWWAEPGRLVGAVWTAPGPAVISGDATGAFKLWDLRDVVRP
jgi:WD40 repeat protein